MLRVMLPVTFPTLASVDVRVPIEVVIAIEVVVVIDVDIATTPVAIPPVVIPGSP
jgi:hypothetical protein